MSSLPVLLLGLCLLLFSSTSAGDQAPVRPEPVDGRNARPYRIAIIGAGAAGSSAAYHLHKFSDSSKNGPPLEISIFDQNPRVGGRTTTVNALDDPRYPTELGASIFVKVNSILANATRDFGLQTQTKIYESAPAAELDLGIWDGTQFVFTQKDESGWRGWLSLAKLLWKYGLSPIRTQWAMKDAVGRFLRFYDEPIFPFRSLQSAVRTTGLLDFTSKTGEETLAAAGVSEQFSRELIQASTRVNYGQNLNGIHGLETMVCMAIDGAMSIEGGNWQIFDEAAKRSRATVKLNTTVRGVSKSEDGKYHVRMAPRRGQRSLGSSADGEAYDTVILAAPYQFANITFDPPLAHTPKPVDYVSLHVTLFTTPHLLAPAFFNLSEQTAVPSSILTTLPKGLHVPFSTSASELTGPAGFWSVSTLRVIPPDPTTNGKYRVQYLYKIFSPKPLTGTFMSHLFGFPHANTTAADPLSDLPASDITWSHEKQWHSYPYLPPIDIFEKLRLDTADDEADSHEHQPSCPAGSLELRDNEAPQRCARDLPDRDASSAGAPERDSVSGTTGGIWYTSGIEPFISTMETSALMGRNVARLIVDQLQRTEK